MSCPFSDREVEDHSEKQKSLLEHYHEHVHNKFNKYAFCFFFCELLNILISVSQVIISYNCTMPSYLHSQIFVTHAFLNYQFLDYGYLVYQYYR